MNFKFLENTNLDSLEAVPSDLHALYTEQPGENEGDPSSFVLNPGVQNLAKDFEELQKSASQAKSKITQANNESAERRVALRAYDDFASEIGVTVDHEAGENTIEKLRDKYNELTSQIKNGEALKTDMDKINKEAESRIERHRREAQNEVERVKGALRTVMVSNEAKSAISLHKGSEPLLLPHVENNAVVIENGDGSYTVQIKDADGKSARLNDAGGFMNVSEFVRSLKNDPSFAAAFSSEAPSGNNTKPDTSAQPPGKPSNPTKGEGSNDEKSPKDKIAAGLASLGVNSNQNAA